MPDYPSPIALAGESEQGYSRVSKNLNKAV
jgi:hypothetical protein